MAEVAAPKPSPGDALDGQQNDADHAEDAGANKPTRYGAEHDHCSDGSQPLAGKIAGNLPLHA